MINERFSRRISRPSFFDGLLFLIHANLVTGIDSKKTVWTYNSFLLTPCEIRKFKSIGAETSMIKTDGRPVHARRDVLKQSAKKGSLANIKYDGSDHDEKHEHVV